MVSLKDNTVCVTGASSGIGSACAEEFAKAGSRLLLVARRKERIVALCDDLEKKYSIQTHSLQLDVRNHRDVERAFLSLPDRWQKIDILINNAGLARGLARLHEGKIDDWQEMIDTNINGLLYVSRAVLPGMVHRDSGHIINIGSIAGHETYPMGNVYAATKHAVAGLTRGLRMDLLGTSVRVSSVDPGMVQTEFSEVRFRGDKVRAAKTYSGVTPLTPADVAEAVLFCATRPEHVNIDRIVLTCADQASVTMVNRK